MIAGWVHKIVDRGLGKVPNMDSTLRPFLSNIVRWVILAFVILAVLSQFGVETTSIIAVMGAAGLAIAAGDALECCIWRHAAFIAAIQSW